MGDYQLVCPSCNQTQPASFDYSCSCGKPGLIYSNYSKKVLDIAPHQGIWKYIDWMPVNSPSSSVSGPVTYKSQGLAEELGLEELWVTFNGYWPEKKALTTSATFKEFEAVVTLQRMKEYNVNNVVVASAGNTARAFAQMSRTNEIDVIDVVPEANLDNVWLTEPECPLLNLISVRNGDYLDAIVLAGRICNLMGYTPEGGAKNIARREGMSSCVLDAAYTIGDIPHHYFQGVGSGTGGISAHEAALRLSASGRFSNKNMRLHLAQNIPFTPMHNAYERGSREIDPDLDMPDGKASVTKVVASMLTNRKPPYSPARGVYDVLHDSNGKTYAVTNDQAEKAMKLFEQLEGADIVPESGVALGALFQAVEAGTIQKGEIVQLNVTGGGVKNVEMDYDVCKAQPLHIVEPDITDEELRGLFE